MTDVTYVQSSDMITAKNTLVETSSVNSLAAQRAGAYAKTVVGIVTPTAAELGATTSVFNMVRVPSQAHIKEIHLEADTALDTSTTTTFAVNIGAAYSNGPSQAPPVPDGTLKTNQASDGSSTKSLLISTTYFASARLFAGSGGDGQAATKASNSIRIAPRSAGWNVADKNRELWDALGLSADPGGFIDITLAVSAAPTTTATGSVALVVTFD